MGITRPGSVRGWALRGTAAALNGLHAVVSAANRGTIRRLAARAPKTLAPRPEQVEENTLRATIPVVQHMVFEDVLGTPIDAAGRRRVETAVREGIQKGTFKNYGQAILINPHRIDELLEDLGISPSLRGKFTREAILHRLHPESFQASQVMGVSGSEFRQRGEEQYIERTHPFLTRDGKTLALTRVVNLNRVKTNDRRPSLIWVPGIASTHGSFDIDDRTSPVLESADLGRWNYLFDPRGMGRNKGNFDPFCFLDTLVSNDLPAAVEFVHDRPTPQKPVILVCHSMGGTIAEFMLVRHSYKLNQLLEKIGGTTRGRTRAEIGAFLNKAENGGGDRALIADARGYLKILASVKALITMGSPKIFDKNYHPIYPVLLSLEFLLPLVGSEDVPVDKGKWLIESFPSLAAVLRPLINAGNFDRPNDFLAKYVAEGTDTFPLGVGFQFLKAIYSGKGVRRMDQDKFNYSAHLDLIPIDIPIFHLGGEGDPLDPPFNMAFIDRRFAAGSALDFSVFPLYSHPVRRVRRVPAEIDPRAIQLDPRGDQVQGFILEGVKHLDYLYGQTAEKMVRPLLNRIIDLVWQIE